MTENENALEIIYNSSGIVGNITAILFYLSPVAVVISVYKKVIDIKSVSFFPVIACYYGTAIWTFNSICNYVTEKKKQPKELYFCICNYTGMLISLCLSIYMLHYYSQGDRKKLGIYIFTLIDTAVEILLMILMVNSISKEKDIGKYVFNYISMCINLLFYCGPLINAIKIWKTGEYVPLDVNNFFIGTANCFLWIIFGICKGIEENYQFVRSLHIIIANGVGFFLCIFYIITYYKFRKQIDDQTSKSEDNVNPPNFNISLHDQEINNEKDISKVKTEPNNSGSLGKSGIEKAIENFY